MAKEVCNIRRFRECQIVLRVMETGSPSGRRLRRKRNVQNKQRASPKNRCTLSSQKNADLPSNLTCPVRVKQETDPPHSEYLPCLQFKEIKDESTELNKCIQNEQHDDCNPSLTSEASRQCDDNIPHGLIPPIEMEDDESDVECAENVDIHANTFFNKTRHAAKIKKKCTLKPQKKTKNQCVKGRDGRTLKTRTKPDSEDVFQCDICGKKFKRYDLLSDHRRGHGRKRPYACDQCDMTFAKPAYLKIHLRRHAGERAFPCDQCGKRFFDKYDLGVHQRDHTGERPYVCRECGKGFKRIYTLNKHLKTHSNEKPFKCNVCGKAYKYGYSYRLHIKSHSE